MDHPPEDSPLNIVVEGNSDVSGCSTFDHPNLVFVGGRYYLNDKNLASVSLPNLLVSRSLNITYNTLLTCVARIYSCSGDYTRLERIKIGSSKDS